MRHRAALRVHADRTGAPPQTAGGSGNRLELASLGRHQPSDVDEARLVGSGGQLDTRRATRRPRSSIGSAGGHTWGGRRARSTWNATGSLGTWRQRARWLLSPRLSVVTGADGKDTAGSPHASKLPDCYDDLVVRPEVREGVAGAGHGVEPVIVERGTPLCRDPEIGTDDFGSVPLLA
jgi:hypothetical protein